MQGQGDTPLRILYVEDHADTAEVLARVLEDGGHRVRVAPDCATALGLAARHPFDLLLCDIALPDGDGCDLLPKLREMGEGKLCAIAFSALGTADDLQRAKGAGFDAHVLKPAELAELLRLIERVCSAERDQEELDRGGDVS